LNRLYLALGLAAAVGLAACKTVGPNFKPPAAPTDAAYLMQGDAPSRLARDSILLVLWINPVYYAIIHGVAIVANS